MQLSIVSIQSILQSIDIAHIHLFLLFFLNSFLSSLFIHTQIYTLYIYHQIYLNLIFFCWGIVCMRIFMYFLLDIDLELDFSWRSCLYRIPLEFILIDSTNRLFRQAPTFVTRNICNTQIYSPTQYIHSIYVHRFFFLLLIHYISLDNWTSFFFLSFIFCSLYYVME